MTSEPRRNNMLMAVMFYEQAAKEWTFIEYYYRENEKTDTNLEFLNDMCWYSKEQILAKVKFIPLILGKEYRYIKF